MRNDSSLPEYLSLLRDPLSKNRRRAAKNLRAARDAAAGAALLEALRDEVRDRRTWETQYQMVMALGECGYREAMLALVSLSSDEATQLEPMVRLALGDAITRLGRAHAHDPEPVLGLLRSQDLDLIEGAVRAVAMLRMQLPPATVAEIVAYASRPENGRMRFWVAAAAAGWSGPTIDRFLAECLTSASAEVRTAAAASQRKEYLEWNPL